MNWKFASLALALMLATGFVCSCSDEDEKPEPIIDPVYTLSNTYTGWTQGSNEYAAYIPSEGDTLIIKVTNATSTLCDLHFISPTWGEAVLKDVTITLNDTAYIFNKPIVATLLEDHSAWTFSAPVDSIAMPNRNPQTEIVTIKNYPITLEGGFMNRYCDNWEIKFKAYLVPRSGHTQNMCFRDGHIGDM